jgi:hypothetical protein
MDERVNDDQFRLAMRSLAGAVNIVATAHSGHR